MNKINIVPDDYFSSLVPLKRCARVEFLTVDGNRIDATVEFAKGEPERPMTYDDLYFKLSSNLSPNSKVKADDVFKAIEMMDSDMEHFYDILEKLEI